LHTELLGNNPHAPLWIGSNARLLSTWRHQFWENSPASAEALAGPLTSQETIFAPLSGSGRLVCGISPRRPSASTRMPRRRGRWKDAPEVEAPHDPVPRAPAPSPSTRTLIVLLALDILLMLFSVVLWQLGIPTLAATAAAAAIALTGDTARRMLAGGGLDIPPALAALPATPALVPPARAPSNDAPAEGTGGQPSAVERAA
jgi:hypothetical protein